MLGRLSQFVRTHSHAQPQNTIIEARRQIAAQKTRQQACHGKLPSDRPPNVAKPDMDEMRSMMKNLWGELPPHVREQMLQSPPKNSSPSTNSKSKIISAIYRMRKKAAE